MHCVQFGIKIRRRQIREAAHRNASQGTFPLAAQIAASSSLNHRRRL
jgi:hypothetical protein